MFPDIADGAWSAFLVGLIVSPHCVGMCGPLYCSFVPMKEQRGESFQMAYHIGRIVSYTVIGMLAGFLSLNIIQAFEWNVTQFFPWLLIGLLLVFASGLDRFLKPRRMVGAKWVARLTLWSRKLPGEVSMFSMGLLTPLLPCAPLYMVLWVALVSGSPLFGAQIMLGFSLGTIPLLWLAQSQYLRHQHKWSQKTIQIIQRSLALIAALILVYRMLWIGAPLDGGACIVG